jgi:hypothetical protein
MDGQMEPPSSQEYHMCLPAEFNELAIFQGNRWPTNDVKVHWLRPEIHLEGFPHTLQTYTRCLWTFMCCGWEDGCNIMPLPPNLLAQNLGTWPTSWVTAGLQMMPWCIGWGRRPTWNGSHIHSKHIQSGWEHSYDMDGQMDPPSSHWDSLRRHCSAIYPSPQVTSVHLAHDPIPLGLRLAG